VNTTWYIPAPTLRAIAAPPAGSSLLLLMRHSVRGDIPANESGFDVPLLPEGHRLARELGAEIGPRLGSLHTSPVLRCVDTAHAVAAGAGSAVTPVMDRLLGDPGAFVEDGRTAAATWRTHGHEAVMTALVTSTRLPGLADGLDATRRLVAHMRAASGERPGVHVFVTHDSLVTAAASHCLGLPLTANDWPYYLEALALVLEEGGVLAFYRDRTGRVPWA